MDAKTTKTIGVVVGAIAGLFFGSQWGAVAEKGTTEIIDRVDSDDDDVNNQGKKGDEK